MVGFVWQKKKARKHVQKKKKKLELAKTPQCREIGSYSRSYLSLDIRFDLACNPIELCSIFPLLSKIQLKHKGNYLW